MRYLFGKVWDVAAITLALAVVLFVGWIVGAYFGLNLLLNDTTRYLYQYREMTSRGDDVSLVPGLFTGGEPKDQVEAQLIGAGLKAWNTAYRKVPPGATDIQIFYLAAGGRHLACGSELFLTIGYDEGDKLVSATIAQGGACL